ncbi:phage portal protein [Clostridium kluyveri]|uniref:Portal protein n=1 Tax=Clostridium kluyveri TaxID=1534 RepID=A0A1L5F465_CLOKL|nr:phage portal protein [Clostridium kluyveri]APM37811.1 portal protein [Clostridium kluyveri]
MDIEEYINRNYNGSKTWFCEEVKQSYNLSRISKVVSNKSYLAGEHKILKKPDIQFKGEEYKTKKLIIQEAKTILNFHGTYLLGKPLSLTGSENKVKEYQNIYRSADYNEIDFDIIDSIGKYGDAYEYVYLDKGKNICSKLIDNADAYPVYSNNNEYIALIEHWTSTYKNIDSNIEYFTIYYTDRVEQWNNENGNLIMVSSSNNLSGLPIHYHNKNDIDPNFGVSLLEDIKPILDEVEDLLSKLGDSIYTLSLSPLPVVTGQQIEGEIDKDVVGFGLSLEFGSDMKYINALMDYNTIKMYLDKIEQKLNMVAHMPSIVGGNSNVANVSEVSLKLLYQLADVYSMIQEKYVRKGLRKRFNIFDKLLELKGIMFNNDDYVSVQFNYSRPVNNEDLLQQLKIQYDMGAISRMSIIERSPVIVDTTQELNRLKEEDVNDGDSRDDNLDGKIVN